jgi:hypothetical protein
MPQVPRPYRRAVIVGVVLALLVAAIIALLFYVVPDPKWYDLPPIR